MESAAEQLPVEIEMLVTGGWAGETSLIVAYGIPAAFSGLGLELGLHDLAGWRVRLLEEGVAQEGRFETRWDMNLEGGTAAGSGLYFVRLRIGDEVHARRVTLIR